MAYTSIPPVSPPAPVTGVGIADAAYLHQLAAGAWLPLSRSLISAAIAWVLAALLTWKLAVDDWLWASTFVAALVLALAWLYFQAQLAHLVGLAEIALNKDLNGNGVIGEDALRRKVQVEETVTVNVRHLEENGSVKTTQRVALPVSPENLRLLADGLLTDGKELSEAVWVGKKKGRPFGDTEWAGLLEAMLRAGWIKRRDEQHPNLGYTPTRLGLSVFREYQTPPSPVQ